MATGLTLEQIKGMGGSPTGGLTLSQLQSAQTPVESKPGFLSALVTDPLKTLVVKPGIRFGQALGSLIAPMLGATPEGIERASRETRTFAGMQIEPQKAFGQGGARRMSEKYNLPFLGEIPLNPGIMEGSDQGKPIMITNPDSPSAKAFRASAKNIAELSATKIDGVLVGGASLKPQEVLEITPPEVLSDIMQRGIYLTGGGALIKGMRELLEGTLKIPVYIAEDPLTSVVRGTGIILESLAAGTPVITSKVAGIPDVLIDHVHGIFVNTRDPGEIVRAVRELGQSQDALRAMSRNCLEWASEKFGLERLADQFGDLYEKTCAS